MVRINLMIIIFEPGEDTDNKADILYNSFKKKINLASHTKCRTYRLKKHRLFSHIVDIV